MALQQNCHPACPGAPWDRSAAQWRDLRFLSRTQTPSLEAEGIPSRIPSASKVTYGLWTSPQSKKVAILFRQVRFGWLYVESDAKTGLVPNVDEAVFDHWIRQAIHDVIPPFGVALRILERDVVLRQHGAHMHLRSDAE